MPSKRSERIEDALRGAMIDLLRAKPLEKITVGEVVEAAGVSKSTLYAHYPNLFVLAQDCYLHEQVYFGPQHKRRADYASRRDAVEETLQVTAERALFFRRNPNLARVIIFGEGISPEYDEARLAEEDLHRDHLEFEYGGSPEPFVCFDECACYIQAGDLGMLRKWFRDGMPGDVERLAKSQVWYSLCVTAGTQGRPIEPEYRRAVEEWHFQERCPREPEGMCRVCGQVRACACEI